MLAYTVFVVYAHMSGLIYKKGVGSQCVQTPMWMWLQFQYTFGELEDVCPIDPQHDALDTETYTWPARAYCNPPYNNIEPFMYRACMEWHHSSKRTVFLVPGRSNAQWYIRYVHALSCTVWPVKGNVRFHGHNSHLPENMVVIYVGRLEPQYVRSLTPRCFLLRPLDVCEVLGEKYRADGKRLKRDDAERLHRYGAWGVYVPASGVRTAAEAPGAKQQHASIRKCHPEIKNGGRKKRRL